MADSDNFPRFRNDEMGIIDFLDVKGFEQGRPDLIAKHSLGSSRMGKALCAANHIRNPFPLRDSVRVFKESLYNELYMRGFRGEELEAEYNKEYDEIAASDKVWKYYNNLSDGVLAEVSYKRTLGVPTLSGILEWVKTYDKSLQ